MAHSESLSIRARYEAALWWTMEQLGITESIERKVIAAVLIQFLSTVGIFLAPFLFSGTLWYLLAGLLFVGASIALVNTVLIVRNDFTGPIKELEAGADEIAAGDLSAEIDRFERPCLIARQRRIKSSE